ncbi:MAG: NAD(P)H-binding protein [Tannerellaceae bacterium]|nr:NAD(P)H-binding protein [Tannerellaceae bacterium]MCD8264838.1 NAD(P)H-binding protein [Tannerellaceae bacterium]
MEKIVLIEATGFVGSELLKEALQRGYHVIAIVREQRKLVIRHPNLSILEGDIMDTDLLARNISGAKALISAYNPGWDEPNLYDETLKGYNSIISAVKKAGVPRLLVVGAAGTLKTKEGHTLMDKDNVPHSLLSAIHALEKVYKEYLEPEKAFDWVFFCPAASLTQGERTGEFRLGKDELITDEKGNSSISVQDYALAMINELEHPEHHRECFTVGY